MKLRKQGDWLGRRRYEAWRRWAGTQIFRSFSRAYPGPRLTWAFLFPFCGCAVVDGSRIRDILHLQSFRLFALVNLLSFLYGIILLSMSCRVNWQKGSHVSWYWNSCLSTYLGTQPSGRSLPRYVNPRERVSIFAGCLEIKGKATALARRQTSSACITSRYKCWNKSITAWFLHNSVKSSSVFMRNLPDQSISQIIRHIIRLISIDSAKKGPQSHENTTILEVNNVKTQKPAQPKKKTEQGVEKKPQNSRHLYKYLRLKQTAASTWYLNALHSSAPLFVYISKVITCLKPETSRQTQIPSVYLKVKACKRLCIWEVVRVLKESLKQSRPPSNASCKSVQKIK